jgi:integrase
MSLYKRSGSDIYWYKFRFAGRVIRETTRSTSLVVAREAERNRRRELEKSYNRIETRKLPPNFTKASTDWLESRKATVCEATIVKYSAALAHLKRYFGGMLVSDIQAADIARYQESRVKEKAAPATINSETICLGSILRSCALWESVKKDGVRLLEEAESKGRALDPDQESKLLNATANTGLKQGHWSPVYTVTSLGLNTGMRHSEIRSLQWLQIDLKSRVLVVGKSKTKAGSGRAVPLNQPAWAALDFWASKYPDRVPTDFVFPACENGKIDPAKPISNWRTAWRNACKDANLEGLGFHSMRHSAATKLLENGVPFAVVAQILGWSASTAVRMAKRYGHIRPEVQRAALEGISTVATVPVRKKETPASRGTGHRIGHSRRAVLKSELHN